MLRIRVYTIGKIKETWLQEAIEEYTKRLKPVVSIEWYLGKQSDHLEQLLEKESKFICLDPQGKLLTSEAFSLWMEESFILGGSRINFVIGGAGGIPALIKAKAHTFISFSPLTFTHQMMRLLLLEQIYRAFEIKKGTSYHK